MRAELFRELERCLAEEELVVLATLLDGPEAGAQLLLRPDGRRLGGLGAGGLDEKVAELAAEAFSSFASRRCRLDVDGEERSVFLEVHPPRPKLIVVGAVHVTVPLVTFANTLGFATWVVDPRSAFATEERFGHADHLVRSWPDEALEAIGVDEATFVAVLSHDFKLDVPALQVALDRPARYVGALGSKRTHAKRRERLLEAGLGEEQVARIHAPIGLDLGGRRAEEIALSIISQMVAVHYGR